MTQKALDFLKMASDNSELEKKLVALSQKSEDTEKEIIAKLLAIPEAVDMGLCEDDFVISNGELSEEEIAAVAGGWRTCSCFLGGGGKSDDEGNTCACVMFGNGARKADGKLRCNCYIGGYGREISKQDYTSMIYDDLGH